MMTSFAAVTTLLASNLAITATLTAGPPLQTANIELLETRYHTDEQPTK